ncbi:MAG TPA: hypothetical protein VNB23_06345, partial [Ramlibacter sp.]|nr:hypothetical protein [Ramlibacter sp.]
MRQVGQPAHLVEPVAQAQDGVEGAAVEGQEFGHLRPQHAALAHHRHAFGRDVDGRHVQAAPLQFERVQPGAGARIEHAAPAKVQRLLLQRIHGVAQPEGGRHVVALAVLVADQHRAALAAEAV